MPYIQTQDRNQIMMCSLDSFVEPESIARVIDAFVDLLNLEDMDFEKAVPAFEGRPGYNPRAMLKLYLYGGQKSVRSSRKLAESCKINIEVKWLMEGLEPDFRTISDFRKDNIDCLKKVFHVFNQKLSEVLKKGFLSVDGSKFQANNSKDNNFTANKLDDRIQWLNQHTDEYLRQLANMDEQEDVAEGQLSREDLEHKLAEAKERLEKYQSYRKHMEENGLSQISLTDIDAKLMKNKNGFAVAYNVQTAVDSESHLIEDYLLTNQPTDHGMLAPTVSGIKEQHPDNVIEVTADKGYNVEGDMVKCLENGVIPHVILPDGQDYYELELEYQENMITAEAVKSKLAEDLSNCIHAGKIPEAYEEVIEKAEVIERKAWIREETEGKKKSLYGSEEEMKGRAKEGYFVRDPERNLVYCPAGEILRQKSVKKNGDIRYANKTACRHCKYRNQCYKGKSEWKEIDFNKDTLEKPNKNWLSMEETEKPERKQRKGHYETKKFVRLVLKPNRNKMSQRMCLSEHPFGTIKRAMNAGYYLLCGKRKVDGETALFCLGYNLKRAMNLLGFEKIMGAIA